MPCGPPHRASNIGCTLATTSSRANVSTTRRDGISRCSRRCRLRRRGSVPRIASASSNPTAIASTAASPMQWKPAWILARVQATTWSRTCSAVT